MTTRPATTIPRVVAVVGASSHIGALLMMQLESTMPQCQLVAVDSHPLLQPVKQVSAYRLEPNRTGAILTIDDIPDVMQFKAWDMVLENRQLTMADIPDVLNLESVDSVIHVGSHYDRDNWAQFVGDTEHWVQACRLANVPQLVYLSDVRVYGVSASHPVPITEQSTTEPAGAHQVLLDAEDALQSGASEAVGGDGLPKISVIRSAMAVGPSGSSPVADELLWPAILSNRKRSFPLQLVHEQDLARAVQIAITNQLEGVYNVAGKGVVASKTVLDMCETASAIKQKTKSERTGSPLGRNMAKYPLIISDTKIRQAAGFETKYSSEQAARAYCHSYLTQPQSRYGRNTPE